MLPLLVGLATPRVVWYLLLWPSSLYFFQLALAAPNAVVQNEFDFLKVEKKNWQENEKVSECRSGGLVLCRGILLSSLYGSLFDRDPILILIISMSLCGDEPKVQQDGSKNTALSKMHISAELLRLLAAFLDVLFFSWQPTLDQDGIQLDDCRAVLRHEAMYSQVVEMVYHWKQLVLAWNLGWHVVCGFQSYYPLIV
jgi:hypothetical protein